MERYDYTFEQTDKRTAPQGETAPAMQTDPAPAVKTRKTGRRFLKFTALALAVAVIAGAAGFGGAALYGAVKPSENVPAASDKTLEGPREDAGTPNESDPGAGLPVLSSGASLNAGSAAALSPEELYEAVLPSCVGITVSTTVNIWGQTTTSAASGSGFILTADGYIATNYHVIEDAAGNSGVDISVTLSGGEKYTAKLVGGDPDNDVAVIKIDAEGLTPVTVGDSSSLRVAQWVFTVGNPLGELTFSFSDGRVSALDRVISTDASSNLNMLQTDCAINPGNSGGPLFDGQGRVVGIVTAKYTRASNSVSAEGLGFAIPIDDVKDMLTDIMEHSYVTGRPLLGVSVSTVTDAMARYGLPRGAAVEAVNEGSCAEKAGLQEGDIITALDGNNVTSSDELSAALSAHRAGDTVTLTVYRQGQTLELTATLDEKPADTQQDAQQSETDVEPWPDFGDGGAYWDWPFGSGRGYGNGGERA